MMCIKREITVDPGQVDFTTQILDSGYFLHAHTDRFNFVFKKKPCNTSIDFGFLYKRLNPFDLLYVRVRPKTILLFVGIGKAVFFLLLLNLLFSALLFIAGIPKPGIALLPCIFLIMQILMVMIYSQLKIEEIAAKITARRTVQPND